MTTRNKKCTKGCGCGSTCIERSDRCNTELGSSANNTATQVADVLAKLGMLAQAGGKGLSNKDIASGLSLIAKAKLEAQGLHGSGYELHGKTTKVADNTAFSTKLPDNWAEKTKFIGSGKAFNETKLVPEAKALLPIYKATAQKLKDGMDPEKAYAEHKAALTSALAPKAKPEPPKPVLGAEVPRPKPNQYFKGDELDGASVADVKAYMKQTRDSASQAIQKLNEMSYSPTIKTDASVIRAGIAETKAKLAAVKELADYAMDRALRDPSSVNPKFGQTKPIADPFARPEKPKPEPEAQTKPDKSSLIGQPKAEIDKFIKETRFATWSQLKDLGSKLSSATRAGDGSARKRLIGNIKNLIQTLKDSEALAKAAYDHLDANGNG